MAGRPWNLRDVREAVRRLEEGEPLQEVADSLGRSRNAVCRIINKVTGRRVVHLLKQGRLYKAKPVVERYLKGELTQFEAGRALGISENGFNSTLRELELTSVKGSSGQRYPTSVARSCYTGRLDGLSHSQIAKKVGIPAGSVSKLLKRYEEILAGNWEEPK